MAFTHSLSKPKGMSYHDFYQGLDKFVTRIAPQKGYKAQYASAGAGAEVVYVFNIISLVLSFIVLVTVVCHFRNRGFSERPSFRLSGSIALADILHSVMMILMHQTDVVVKLSPMQLRIVWFFVLGSLFTSLFITDCIALQLHLTVIYKKERLAKKLNPWYELIGWTLGFVTVHPILYICQDLNWFNGPNALIFVDTSVQAITLKIWAMYIWLLLGILYCMVISIMVGIQLMSMLKGTRRTPMNFREGGGGGGSRNNAKEDNDEDHDTNVVNPNNNNNHHNNNNNDINFDVLSTTASTNPINLCTKQQHPKYSIDDEEDQTEYFNSELSNTMIETNATAFTLDERDMTTTNNNNNNININIDDIKLPNLENLKQVPLGYHNNKNPSDSDAKAGPVNTKTTDKVPNYIKKRRKNAIFAIFRMLLYPIVPLVTLTINPIFASTKYSTYEFCIAVLMLAAVQGIIESVIFFMNPMLDPMWEKIFGKIKQTIKCNKLLLLLQYKKRRQTNNFQTLKDFNSINTTTQ